MSNDRGYQLGFYDSHPNIQDKGKRKKKAEKMLYFLRKYCPIPLNKLVCVDVGCSAGFITKELSSSFKVTIGIEYDLSTLRLNDHSNNHEGLNFVNGDGMLLPIADQSVDIIVCAQVYEHVPDDARLFKELSRIIKPQGIIYFSGPNKLFPIELHYNLPFLHWLPKSVADVYLKLMGKGKHFYERLRTPKELKAMLYEFRVHDLSLELIEQYSLLDENKLILKILSALPKWLLRLLNRFVPNLNWLLFKKS